MKYDEIKGSRIRFAQNAMSGPHQRCANIRHSLTARDVCIAKGLPITAIKNSALAFSASAIGILAQLELIQLGPYLRYVACSQLGSDQSRSALQKTKPKNVMIEEP